ncbi:copper resistance protein NlpE N-terminal domain-containing protein [Acidithiobacillus sp. M4-SHS-6]|uniref:copper resistance protein NlpE N-terminal domain-containing protein n=1 Tax=Acidithiobacillus sp. M4-SHS-6 TaxID=3383024 RepID=UPI0039BEB4B2
MTKYVRIGLVLPFAVLLAACASVTSPMTHSPPPASSSTSRNSLDWQGSYAGDLPCADCPGIRSTVALKDDGVYVLTMQYADRGPEITKYTGHFRWQADGKVIDLLGTNGQDNGKYAVRENALAPLTADGKPLQFANKTWLLHKVSAQDAAQGLYASYEWRLTSLTGYPHLPVPEATAPYLVFLPAEQRVAGFDGCNRIAGGVELQAHKQLHFSHLVSTRMACVGVSIDGPFSRVLEQTRSYDLQGTLLQFKDAKGRVLARFQAVATPSKSHD